MATKDNAPGQGGAETGISAASITKTLWKHQLPFSKQSGSGDLAISKTGGRIKISRSPIYVYLGCDEAWKRAKRECSLGYPVLLLPATDPAEIYEWPVKGRHVMLHALEPIDADCLVRICEAIMSAGARSLMTLGKCDCLMCRRQAKGAAA